MDFMHASKQNLSFNYFKINTTEDNKTSKSTQHNITRFNDYFLINNHANFKGLNLIHKNYVSISKHAFTTAFDEQNLQIGPYCVIEEDCKIENCAEIANSVVLKGVVLGTGVEIKDSILGERANIGEGSKILNSSVIAEGVKIPARHLLKQAKIAKIK